MWDDRRRVVFWADIPEGRLFACGDDGRDARVVYTGKNVGGFCLAGDGSLLLFREDDVVLYDPDAARVVRTVVTLDDPQTQRFNDCQPAPDPDTGGVYAGTIGRDPADLAGGLWHLAPDGRLTNLFRGTQVANGMDFSPDGRTFYWVDTTGRTVYAFDASPAGINVGSRRVLHVGGESHGPGKPDGLVVDAGGGVWIARNGTGLVTRHDPADGREVARLRIPVLKVTSLCFGGDGLSTLYVTTAGGGTQGALSDDGTLYKVTGTGAVGVPVPRP